MKRTSAASLVALAASLSGCFIVPRTASPTAGVDDAYNQRVIEARAAYQASHAAPDAIVFAVTVQTLYGAGTVERGKADGAALVAEAAGYLDAAAAQSPADAPASLAAKGELYLAAGDSATARAALEASVEARPTLPAVAPLLGIYGEAGDARSVTDLCKRMRTVARDDERYPLLDVCFRHSGAERVEAGLAWAGAADIAYYLQARAAGEAQAADRAAARQAQRDQDAAARAAQAPPPRSSDDRPAPSAAPATVSVTLRGTCGQTVRLFFGADPKYGGGTRTSLSANTVTSYSKRPGDMIWLVDDHDRGLGSVTVGASTREVTVTCSEITAR